MQQGFRLLAKKTPKADVVVFAGRTGGRFVDNVKYLFSHCVLEKQPFTPFFLTHYEVEYRTMRSLGLPCLFFPSEEAMAMLPRARVVVADDSWWKTKTLSYHLLSQAVAVQLWHGIPLKLIGFPEIASAVNMDQDKARELRRGYSGYKAVVSTSPFVTKTALSKAFEAEHFWETGYPRNDVLFREPTHVEMLGVDRETLAEMQRLRSAGAKVVFYMPTFRDTGGDAFMDKALDPLALERFNQRMGCVLFIKFHPYVDTQIDSGLSTIRFVASHTDAYPLLPHVDVLLTDYSSVAYDFLLTDRPVVFFPYDLDKYLTRDREMFYAFEDMAPGPRPAEQGGLFEALAEALAAGGGADGLTDAWADKRTALRDKLFRHHDGGAAGRIAHHLRRSFF